MTVILGLSLCAKARRDGTGDGGSASGGRPERGTSLWRVVPRSRAGPRRVLPAMIRQVRDDELSIAMSMLWRPRPPASWRGDVALLRQGLALAPASAIAVTIRGHARSPTRRSGPGTYRGCRFGGHCQMREVSEAVITADGDDIAMPGRGFDRRPRSSASTIRRNGDRGVAKAGDPTAGRCRDRCRFGRAAISPSRPQERGAARVESVSMPRGIAASPAAVVTDSWTGRHLRCSRPAPASASTAGSRQTGEPQRLAIWRARGRGFGVPGVL